MKGGQDNRVAVNPWSCQQQIVGRVSIDDITRHLRFQIPNLASELDYAHRPRTIGVEIINGSLSNAQSVDGDSQVWHVPVRHNAQHGPWINPNVGSLYMTQYNLCST